MSNLDSDDSDGIEILTLPSFNKNNQQQQSNGFNQPLLTKQKSQVIVLSDSSDDDHDHNSQALPSLARKNTPVMRTISSQPTIASTTSDDFDLPYLRMFGTSNNTNNNNNNNGLARSKSLIETGGSSTISNGYTSNKASTSTSASSSNFRPSGLAPPSKTTSTYRYAHEKDFDMYDLPAAGAVLSRSTSNTSNDKGKGKGKEILNIESSPPASRISTAAKKGRTLGGNKNDDDELDDFFARPATTNSNGNGKRQRSKSSSLDFPDSDDEQATRSRKNSKSRTAGNGGGTESDYDEDLDVGIGAKRTKRPFNPKKASPKKPSPRKSNSNNPADKFPKETEAQAKKDAKEVLKSTKSKEMEYKKLIRSINLLKQRRVDTVGEITVRCSGYAFMDQDELDANEEQEEGANVGNGKGKGKAKSKKSKSSSWLSITQSLKERLELISTNEANKDSGDWICKTLLPEVPRIDVGCEGAMRWTRICNKKWNSSKGLFEPLEKGREILVEEDSRLIFITAETISTHIASNNFLQHMQAIKVALPSHINLFILVYGLQTLLNKIRNSQAAVYRDVIRNGGVEVDTSGEKLAGKGRTNGIGSDQPSSETIELELMRVQVATKCFTIHVEKEDEAVTWLEQLTLDVGYKPYKRQLIAPEIALGTTEFTIQIGKTSQETYMYMLTTIKGITQPMARGVLAEYPSIRKLYEGWEACSSEKEKREMLVGIWKNNNRNGTATNRAFGPALSTLIYNVFTGRDSAMRISSD